MDEKIYDIWLSYLDIKNSVKLKLLSKFTSKEIYFLDNNILEKEKIDRESSKKLLTIKNLYGLKSILKYLKLNNIKLITIREKEYPRKLHNIEDKPAMIYARGNIKILDHDSVGIVGSRIATNFGKELSRKTAQQLADKNINIISGLSIGIDKYAHLGALDSKIGKTIAVLGNGLGNEEIYPNENKGVFDRILFNGGAVISEYPLGTKPEREHFPERNRIISGLSDKVLVIEARERSGALITANYALEQGKDVFSVPGNINSKNSIGTNNLIKEGAFLFSKVEDIFAI